nr:SpaA isopeptide-forming pilin-related protein [uncultured Blautia sp.]
MSTPQVLPAGEYTLVEVQAPYGYVLDSTPIPFTVTMTENEEISGLNVITVTAYDMAQKGKITVTKTGEGFASVAVSGKEVENEDGSTTLTDCIYQPVYEDVALAGAVYDVIAAEDIYTGDGTLRYEAGTIVDQITTNENGAATTKELYLGKYQVIETQAPEGYVLNSTPVDVELVYAGQEVSVTDAATGFENERQKIRIDAVKAMEQDETFHLGMNSEMTAVSFGLYAKEEIVAADGSVIPADGLIEIAFCEEDGSINFKSDLPFGSYYVKEVSTDPHYLMSGSVYEFTFTYVGQDTALMIAELNDMNPIENNLKRGKIEGYKVNGEEKGLSGATFGLFDEWAQDYTEESAYMTVVSEENGYFSFENVPYGDYVVVELEAPEGYVGTDAHHFVSVTYDTQVIGVKTINYQIVGSVKLTKVDKEYPENHLIGAVFELYADTDKDGEFNDEIDECLGELTEVNDGIYEKGGLLYGSYFIKERTAPEGFLLDENVYPFSIVNDKEVVTIENEAGVGFINQPIRGEVTIFERDVPQLRFLF